MFEQEGMVVGGGGGGGVNDCNMMVLLLYKINLRLDQRKFDSQPNFLKFWGASGKHVHEMYVPPYPPEPPLLYRKTGICRGIPIFLIFAQNTDCAGIFLAILGRGSRAFAIGKISDVNPEFGKFSEYSKLIILPS